MTPLDRIARCRAAFINEDGSVTLVDTNGRVVEVSSPVYTREDLAFLASVGVAPCS